MKNKVYYYLRNDGKKSLLLCSGLNVINGAYRLVRRKKDGKLFIPYPSNKITKESIEVFYLCDAPSQSENYDYILNAVGQRIEKER